MFLKSQFIQGTERNKTMDDKLMYIPNDDTQIYPNVDYNQWLKQFDTQLNESTNQNLIKVFKV